MASYRSWIFETDAPLDVFRYWFLRTLRSSGWTVDDADVYDRDVEGPPGRAYLRFTYADDGVQLQAKIRSRFLRGSASGVARDLLQVGRRAQAHSRTDASARRGAEAARRRSPGTAEAGSAGTGETESAGTGETESAGPREDGAEEEAAAGRRPEGEEAGREGVEAGADQGPGSGAGPPDGDGPEDEANGPNG